MRALASLAALGAAVLLLMLVLSEDAPEWEAFEPLRPAERSAEAAPTEKLAADATSAEQRESAAVGPRAAVESASDRAQSSGALGAGELDAHAFFHGIALAAEDDRPLAGIRVHVEQRSASSEDVGLRRAPWQRADSTAISDAAGRFRLALERWSGGTARATGEGRALVRFPVDVAGADPDAPVRVRLARAASLFGTVRGAEGRDEARVEARCRRHELGAAGSHLGGDRADVSDERFSAPIAADGSFELRPLPPEVPLELRVLAGKTVLHVEPRPLALAPGEERRVDWSVGTGALLSVRALSPRGTPEPGVELALYPRSVSGGMSLADVNWRASRSGTSDAAGRLEWSEVTSGAWLVAPRPTRSARDEGPVPPDAIVPLAVPVEIAAGQGFVELDVTIQRGLSIQGRLFDADGEPVADRQLYCHGETRGAVTAATTGPEGAFELGPLVPGRYTVHVLPRGRGEGDAGTEAVEVEAGTRGLVLRLLGAGSLSVRILHAASGEQLSGRVTVHSLESGVRRSASGGASSPIEIHGLAGGSHHVIAQAAGGLVGCAREVPVEPGRTQPIDVLVARGGELRVHYSGPHEPAWFELTQDGVRYALENVAPGTSKLAVLPAGRVRARVLAFTGEPGAAGEEPRVLLERELDLAAGELTLLRCEVE